MLVRALLTCFALWVVAAWIHHSYSSSLPKGPDEKGGRIYPVEVRGSTRYASRREVRTLGAIDNSRPLAFLCFLAALIIGLSSGYLKIAPGRTLNE